MVVWISFFELNWVILSNSRFWPSLMHSTLSTEGWPMERRGPAFVYRCNMQCATMKDVFECLVDSFLLIFSPLNRVESSRVWFYSLLTDRPYSQAGTQMHPLDMLRGRELWINLRTISSVEWNETELRGSEAEAEVEVEVEVNWIEPNWIQRKQREEKKTNASRASQLSTHTKQHMMHRNIEKYDKVHEKYFDSCIVAFWCFW